MKQVQREFYELPPKFEPERWRKYLEASCYVYALNLPLNKMVLIGSFIGNVCKSDTPDDEIDRVLKEEVSYIFDYDIEEITEDYPLKIGQKKIFIERNKYGFYHMFREDEGGIWSHKMPGGLPQLVDRIALMNRLSSGCTTVKCYLLTRRGLA